MCAHWIADFPSRHPLFAQLATLQLPHWESWPTPQTLTQQYLTQHPGASAIEFVDQDCLPADGCYYETRVARDGVIPTRSENWHDFFNALIWLSFPKAKQALNRLHVREMATQIAGRTPARDAATLFDESGLIVLAPDDTLEDRLRKRDWADLFQQQRGKWFKAWPVWVFGHAIMEKALAPHLGMTAKCWILRQPADWQNWDARERLYWIDTQLAQQLDEGRLQRPRQLPVLPILGIPGWWPLQNEAFYADTRHFCPAPSTGI